MPRTSAAILLATSLLAMGTSVLQPATAAAALTDPASCPAPPAVTTAAPAVAPTHVTGELDASRFTVAGGRVAVLQHGASEVVVHSTNGALLSRFTVPVTDAATSSIAMDVDGSIYLVRYPYGLVKYSPTGQELWSQPLGEVGAAVFLQGTGTSAVVGVALRDRPESLLFTTSGAAAGRSAVSGQRFTKADDGSVVAVHDGRYVRVYSATGVLQSSFGAATKDNAPMPDGAPLHLYSAGSAVRLSDGKYVVVDQQRGLILLSAEGLLLGAMPGQLLDPSGIVDGSSLAVDGGRLYVTTGRRFSAQQKVTSVPVSEVVDRATGRWKADARLGIGAGLTSRQPLLFTPAGSTPDLRLTFEPWYASIAPRLSVCWTLSTVDDLRAGRRGKAHQSPVDAAAMSSQGAPLPLTGLAPGYYQVDATLQRDGVPVTGTKVLLTVAADGARLDFSTLPDGTDAGGPLPARGVAFADVLGTGAHRTGMKWDVLLKNGITAPLDTSVYEAQYAAAAQEAAARGTTFIVQVGEGGPEREIVANGTWSARTREIVSKLKGSVHVWEAWNEPNNTFGSATDYVNRVLKPFYLAVKAEDPTALVVGGSTLEVSLPYWKELVAAGGLQYMDVAGVHPYTGHNRSWEEQGTVAQLQQLKALLVKDGKPVPLWNTEHAFWSDGEANLLGQADMTARELLWNRAVGIDKWAYFIPEGTWGDSDISYSAIQAGGYVKPAALALMTTSAELQGRQYQGLVELGHSSAYAMRFGPRAGGTDQLLVTWTDGMRLPASLKGRDGTPLTKVDLLGQRTDSTVNGAVPLELGPSPVFLRTPAAEALTVQLNETFGPNMALSSAGATVSASSSRPTNPASGAIDGDSTAAGRGDLPWMPAWGQAPGDDAPTLTVRLPRPETLNRVLVSTHSNGSVVTSLRDYDVEVRNGDGAWQSVAQVRGQYHYRQQMVTFAPQLVTEIRVRSLLVNFSGYAGGAKPSWWPTDAVRLGDAQASWYGPAVISEIAAYAPGQVTGSPSPSPTVLPPAPSTPTPSTPAPTTPAPTTPAPTVSPAPVVTPSPGATSKPPKIKGPKPR